MDHKNPFFPLDVSLFLDVTRHSLAWFVSNFEDNFRSPKTPEVDRMVHLQMVNRTLDLGDSQSFWKPNHLEGEPFVKLFFLGGVSLLNLNCSDIKGGGGRVINSLTISPSFGINSQLRLRLKLDPDLLVAGLTRKTMWSSHRPSYPSFRWVNFPRKKNNVWSRPFRSWNHN